jgi:hypothetical protein
MKNLSKAELNGVLIRLAITFVQGFVAAWALTNYQVNRGVVGGLIAGGLSAVYNTFVKPSINKSDNVTGA